MQNVRIEKSISWPIDWLVCSKAGWWPSGWKKCSPASRSKDLLRHTEIQQNVLFLPSTVTFKILQNSLTATVFVCSCFRVSVVVVIVASQLQPHQKQEQQQKHRTEGEKSERMRTLPLSCLFWQLPDTPLAIMLPTFFAFLSLSP